MASLKGPLTPFTFSSSAFAASKDTFDESNGWSARPSNAAAVTASDSVTTPHPDRT